MGPVPKWLKNMKPVSPFRAEADFVEIEGYPSIEAVGADWSDALVRKGGGLCPRAPVVFDANNATGAAAWGPTARGAIVVAIRGDVEFEEMALNAAGAGALALIVVDNDPVWHNDFVMTADTGAPPPIPAVLVPKEHAEHMCSGTGDLMVAISRRSYKLTTREVAKNIASAYWPF